MGKETARQNDENGLVADLKTLWSELLDVPQDAIFKDSHFLYLGGDSVSLITLQIRIAYDLGVDVTPDLLYEHLQFDEMSACLSIQKKE